MSNKDPIPTLVQKEVTLDDSSMLVWCEVANRGCYSTVWQLPNGRTEKAVVNLTDVIFQRLIDNFNRQGKDVLVDYEHRSHNGDDTTAAGWLKKMRIGVRGLEGLIQFTPAAAAKIKARELRFLSPAWVAARDDAPAQMLSVGLTNQPNFATLRPVLDNKADGGVNKHKESKMDPNKLTAALGLSAEATEDDILAAVTGLVKQVKDLTEAQAETEANQAYEENKAKLSCNKADFVTAYKANPAGVTAALGFVAAPAEPEKKVSLNKGVVPAAFTGGKVSLNKLDEYDNMSEGPAKVAFGAKHATELFALRQQRETV